MVTELRIRNQARNQWVRALSQAYSSQIEVQDPSLWLTRDVEIEEKMMRDVDIAHAVNFRRKLIAGRRWNLVPLFDGSPRAPVATSVGTKLLESIRQFSTARHNLAYAFLPGARFAKIHGKTKRLPLGDGRMRTWWLPVRLEDMDKRMLRIKPHREPTTNEGAGTWEVWDVWDKQWHDLSVSEASNMIRHVYDDDQASLGYGRGLREALGWTWYAKQHLNQESLGAAERYGQGIIHAMVDGARDGATGRPNDDVVTSWKDELEDMRARHVLVSDKNDEVSFVQMDGQGWQMLGELRAEHANKVYTLVLGANLTTAANEGGSYALAEIQENSTEALIQYDREVLQETLTDDLLGAIWRRNKPNLVELGIWDEKPRFVITDEKLQDPLERSNVAVQLNSMGVDLSKDDLYEQTGFKRPEPGEDVVSGRHDMASMPFGEFGDLTPAEVTSAAESKGIRPQDLQETALNGAQVTAAAELIEKVARNELPAGVVEKMLVAMFNLSPEIARSMVAEAKEFTPETLEPVVE